MNDSQYHQMVDDVLITLEEMLDECAVDIDYESASSILSLTFENGSKIIINKQPPLHQIWVATKFNGHHFNYKDELWIDERTGVEFWSFIDEAASKQAEQAVSLTRPK
ncbi:MAG: CyaY protein [Paraglaciecola sp.]|jgi:CyaY protein